MAASEGGLRPYNRLHGYNSGNMVEFWITNGETEDIFQGDPVIMTATGEIDPMGAIGDANVLGVFMGCSYEDSTGQIRQTNFYNGDVAKDGMVAHVIVDPFQVYKVRIGNSDANTTMTRGDIGLNYDIEFLAGNTTTGQSGAILDSGTSGATSAANLKLLGLVNDDGSDSPTKASTSTTYTHGLVIIDPAISFSLTGTGI